MTASGSGPVLELEELLDPTRLAAAWQVARERAPSPGTASAPGEVEAEAEREADASGGAGTASRGDATGAVPAVEADAPVRAAPLPVALAHRQLLGELERMRAASPAFADKARLALETPLARLAAAIDPTGAAAGAPLDAVATEAMIDDLEDLLQALLSAAGWPASGEE